MILAKKKNMAVMESETSAEKTSASSEPRIQKWDTETYLKGSLIASVILIGLMMVLYIPKMMLSTIWGSGIMVAGVLTVLAYLYAERYVAMRVLVRLVTWIVMLLAIAYFLVVGIGIYLQLAVVAPLIDILPIIAAQGLYSCVLLWFMAVPLVAVCRARKPLDIWVLRIGTICGCLLLVAGCVFGGVAAWGLDNGYFKLFTCLIAMLTANFACLMKPINPQASKKKKI